MAKFRDAVEFLSMPICHGYSFDHPSIDKIAAGYFSNMSRIQSLGRLPVLLTGVAWMTATYDMVARNQLQLRHDDPRLDPEAILFEPHMLLHKEEIRMELQAEWFGRTQTKKTKSGMEIGEDVLSRLFATRNAELSEGINAVLVGMITGMWTSFEVMAEELWNATIKERPLLNEGWSSKEREDAGFRSTQKLANRYRSTFRNDATNIHDIIGDERIEGLCLTRNLFTHKAGKIDNEFDDRRKGKGKSKGRLLPSLDCFNAYKLHDTIPVTGPIVNHLISPLPHLGLELIHLVDVWLKTH